jgi:site-specific DNA recombinase
MPDVADRSNPLDGYIRVSRVGGREGDTFISPEVQRDQIETWAKLRGVMIGEWHTDLDVSGAKASRPGLDEALWRIETGLSGGLVVAKLDRFARSLTTALEAIQRIHDAGAEFVSVADGVDPSTPAGKAMLRIMLVFAEMHLDNVRENWRTARERAVARGVHISSAIPTGYTKRPDGRLAPHPDFAEAMSELFERKAAGETWTQLAEFMESTGVTGPYGPVNWRAPRVIANMIRNRVYIGEARSGEFVNPNAHKAIVPRHVWEAANAVRSPATPRTVEGALLAGIIRCAGCRHPMKPGHMNANGKRVWYYRCRTQQSSGKCAAPTAAIGRHIEPWVEQHFLEHLRAFRVESEQGDEIGRAQAEVDAAEHELAAYRDDERIADVLGTDRFVAGLKKRVDRVDVAYATLADAQQAANPAGLKLGGIRDIWPDLSVPERRQVLAATIDVVFVRRGKRLPLDERALILWHGEAPDDLPRRGRRVALAPFVWPDDPQAHPGMAGGKHLK